MTQNKSTQQNEPQAFDSGFHMHNLMHSLHEQLNHIHEVIGNTLHHSSQVLQNLQQTQQPTQSNAQQHQTNENAPPPNEGSAQPQSEKYSEPAYQSVPPTGIDSVVAAVDSAAQHLFGEMRSEAQQVLQQGGQALHMAEGQAPSPQQYLHGVAAALQNSGAAPHEQRVHSPESATHNANEQRTDQHQSSNIVNDAETAVGKLQRDALARVHEAEQHMKASMAKIGHAAEAQVQALTTHNSVTLEAMQMQQHQTPGGEHVSPTSANVDPTGHPASPGQASPKL